MLQEWLHQTESISDLNEERYVTPSAWQQLNQAAPAWVQAVGSVGAVYLAGRSVILASRSARLNKLYGVDAVFCLAADTIAEALGTFTEVNGKTGRWQYFDRSKFTYASRLVGQLETSLVDLGSERLPFLTYETQVILQRAETAFDNASVTGLGSNRPPLVAKIKKEFELAEANRAVVFSYVKRQRRLTKWWWVPWVVDD